MIKKFQQKVWPFTKLNEIINKINDFEKNGVSNNNNNENNFYCYSYPTQNSGFALNHSVINDIQNTNIKYNGILYNFVNNEKNVYLKQTSNIPIVLQEYGNIENYINYEIIKNIVLKILNHYIMSEISDKQLTTIDDIKNYYNVINEDNVETFMLYGSNFVYILSIIDICQKLNNDIDDLPDIFTEEEIEYIKLFKTMFIASNKLNNEEIEIWNVKMIRDLLPKPDKYLFSELNINELINKEPIEIYNTIEESSINYIKQSIIENIDIIYNITKDELEYNSKEHLIEILDVMIRNKDDNFYESLTNKWELTRVTREDIMITDISNPY